MNQILKDFSDNNENKLEDQNYINYLTEILSGNLPALQPISGSSSIEIKE